MSDRRPISPRPARLALAVVLLYACWLGMLALHEFGHVLNAYASDGKVVEVVIPPLGFSHTVIEPNPHKRFVAWGGAHWGAAIPLTACGLALIFRRRVPEPLKFFTGFCLIANGVYLGLGWIFRGNGNDATDLVNLGTPPGALVAFGIAATLFGLAIWHRLKWLTLRRAELEPEMNADKRG